VIRSGPALEHRSVVWPVELCGVARQVAENFRPIAEHAGCTLASDLPEGSLIACGDPLAVQEIVDNLVSNAIK
jgi:two-component system OmpR family sensor kinase